MIEEEIVIGREREFKNILVYRYIDHHNFVAGFLEVDPYIVSRSDIIDIVIDDRLRGCVSSMEKVAVDFHHVGERIFYLIILFPGDKVIRELESDSNIRMSTSQWKGIEVTARYDSNRCKLFDYLFSFSKPFPSTYRPSLIVGEPYKTALPRLYLYNSSTPVLPRSLDWIADVEEGSIVITPMGILGLIGGELTYAEERSLITYINNLIENRYADLYVKNSILSRVYTVEEYIGLLKEHLSTSDVNFLIPFVDLSEKPSNALCIIYIDEDGHNLIRLGVSGKNIVEIDDRRIIISRLNDHIIYKMDKISIWQRIHIENLGIPTSRRYYQLYLNDKLYWDSGSSERLISLFKMLSENS